MNKKIVSIFLLDLLRNLGFVDFGDYFGRFSFLFWGVISTFRILPPKKETKIGSKEPQNRQNLGYARGLLVAFVILGFPLQVMANHKICKTPCAYLSSESFRRYADFVYDETKNTIDLPRMRPGSVIFLKTDLLDNFFSTIHPYIPFPYILITHDSDYPAPMNWAVALEDKKLIVWFAQNVSLSHPKLKPLPIGVMSPNAGCGNPSFLDLKYELLEKEHLLYLNFSIWTHPQVRQYVFDLFSSRPYCSVGQWQWGSEYFRSLSAAKFVLSPRGNGLDCYRTWETLYVRSYPIVQASPMDGAFEGLPVLIIDDWNCLSKEFLEKKYQRMSEQTYQWERLEPKYWFSLIDSFKPQN